MIENWSATKYYSTGERVLYEEDEYTAKENNRNVRPPDNSTIWEDITIEIISGIQPVSPDVLTTIATGSTHALPSTGIGHVKIISNNNENINSNPAILSSYMGFDFASSIYAMARVGSMIYIGGSVITVSSNFIPSNQSIVGFCIYDINTGQFVRPVATVATPAPPTPIILSILPMDNGKIYVTGTFTILYGVPANNIIVYDPLNQTLSAIGTGLNNTGSSLERFSPTVLLVGGSFTIAGGVACLRIAFLDTSTNIFTPVTNVTSGLTSGFCYVIKNDPDTQMIYVGGDFASVQNVGIVVPNTNLIARFNTNTLTWESMSVSLMGTQPVYDIALHEDDDRIYVVGNFISRFSTIFDISQYLGGFMEIENASTIYPIITNNYNGSLLGGSANNPFKVRIINDKLYIFGVILHSQVLTSNVERTVGGIVYSDTLVNGTKFKPLGNGCGAIRAIVDSDDPNIFYLGIIGGLGHSTNLSIDTGFVKMDLSNEQVITGTFIHNGRTYTNAQFSSKGTAIRLVSVENGWIVKSNTPTLPTPITEASNIGHKSASTVRFF